MKKSISDDGVPSIILIPTQPADYIYFNEVLYNLRNTFILGDKEIQPSSEIFFVFFLVAMGTAVTPILSIISFALLSVCVEVVAIVVDTHPLM